MFLIKLNKNKLVEIFEMVSGFQVSFLAK